MRPDKRINAIVAYRFARDSESNDIEMHAAMVMSNHLHLIVTDKKGRRSDFMRDAMGNIARARNRDLGRKDYFWDGRQYCETLLLDRDAEERKLLYVWLNPVLAGLVGRAEEWPGFKILPRDWGTTIRVPRPDMFFSDRLPEFVEFTPQPPPGYEDKPLEEVIAYFEKLLKDAEDELAEERRRQGRRLVGVKRVLATSPTSRPRTREERGGIRPRFASKNPEVMRAAIALEREFRSEYARQRERWLKGKKGVVFPCGTLWLRRNAPITCCEPDGCEAGLAANM
ncbi:hypothetical protein FRC98_14000 [Lujinxingia vulgaris]|uniref:Transposase IS200-like domain-containing protein n=1 Tax=Lujinxingia vulgaris TaxID=2600176 RepID=A0A5C6X954_9DELT|nr:hypothetical protein [Lujinxingia vulgaris]TXD36231.1 hypothetical protein FRC98_14000 [Lujinxingia vulgaris]